MVPSAPHRAARRRRTISDNLRIAYKVMSYSAVLSLCMVRAEARTLEVETVLETPFPYMTMEADLREVLGDMGRRVGVTIRVNDAVRGSVSVDNADGDVGSMLDSVLSQVGATWWFDGLIFYVEPQASLQTRLMVSQGLTLREIEGEMRSLQLTDPRFPVTATADGSILRVAGPAGYVDQVVALVETLIAARRAQTGTPAELGQFRPRVFYGRAIN